jgi:hypothetical protein
MRRLLSHLAIPLLLAIAAPVLAQTTNTPLPAVPPPPPEMTAFDAALEPEVTIKKRDGETVEEFRISGKLYMIKVTPASGPAYYLVDDNGTGKFSRQDSTDSGVRVPRWVIGTF